MAHRICIVEQFLGLRQFEDCIDLMVHHYRELEGAVHFLVFRQVFLILRQSGWIELSFLVRSQFPILLVPMVCSACTSLVIASQGLFSSDDSLLLLILLGLVIVLCFLVCFVFVLVPV